MERTTLDALSWQLSKGEQRIDEVEEGRAIRLDAMLGRRTVVGTGMIIEPLQRTRKRSSLYVAEEVAVGVTSWIFPVLPCVQDKFL